jgi:hypothetical protein
MFGVFSLQDFTVLPTNQFRRCVIRSSSVIFLPMSSLTDYVRRLSLHRWFPLPLLYRSEKQKNHLPMVLQREFVRQKKRFPLEIYQWIFIPLVILWLTDGNYPLVNPSVSVWNTDRIYPSVNSSVLVAATVKCRRNNSVGKSVGECLKYRPNSSVGKILGNSFFLNFFLKNYLGYII